jgi:hypothetical protein
MPTTHQEEAIMSTVVMLANGEELELSDEQLAEAREIRARTPSLRFGTVEQAATLLALARRDDPGLFTQ